jgi:hypothetical protein
MSSLFGGALPGMGKKGKEDEEALKQGNNSGESLLPSTSPSGLGFFGSSYDAADQLPRPSQIGVRDGDSLGSVVDAVKGVAYYTDAIGFGGSTNFLSRGMGLQPLGVNYFMNTGQTCSNGATMYQYFEGIPTGNAIGKKVGQAMAEQGIALKGLVPGMMEDVQGALNPMPLLNAMLGSGYPQCKEMTGQVGDMNGRIADPETGENWIEDPQTAFQGSDGRMYQTRWVLDTDGRGNAITLSRDEWTNTPKTRNPNGTPLNEYFTSSMVSTASTVAVVTILLLLGYGLMSRKIR